MSTDVCPDHGFDCSQPFDEKETDPDLTDSLIASNNEWLFVNNPSLTQGQVLDLLRSLGHEELVERYNQAQQRALEDLLLEYVASTQPNLLSTVRRLVALQDSQREIERYPRNPPADEDDEDSSCSICDDEDY